MDWIDGFYSKTGTWWGNAESAVTDMDHKRLATLERLCGSGKKRILDMGSSYGNTAVVMAQAGHDVVGIEISDRIDFARKYESQAENGTLQFIKEDFYKVSFEQPFDVICYWNGFGIGDDKDQRKLLEKMAGNWLKPHGKILMDVQNPVCWINWTGDEEHLKADPERGYQHNVSERIDFDPINNRFIDTWWETEKPEEKFSQSIRCYSPADLSLLLEGIDVKLDRIEIDGEEINLNATYNSHHPIWKKNEYLVILSKTS
jgi:SAM-dependent methyltransferase